MGREGACAGARKKPIFVGILNSAVEPILLFYIFKRIIPSIRTGRRIRLSVPINAIGNAATTVNTTITTTAAASTAATTTTTISSNCYDLIIGNRTVPAALTRTWYVPFVRPVTSLSVTLIQVSSVESLYSIAVVTPVSFPSLLAKVLQSALPAEGVSAW